MIHSQAYPSKYSLDAPSLANYPIRNVQTRLALAMEAWLKVLLHLSWEPVSLTPIPEPIFCWRNGQNWQT
jgi:hypothetical protein